MSEWKKNALSMISGGGYERRRPIIATLIAAALLTTALHAPASADSTINQTHKLLADDGGSSDQFGRSVGLSGETAIIGAQGDDDGGSTTGSAYVFNTTSGNQTWKLTASDAGVGDRFGHTVDLSGTTAIVGAPLDNHNGLSDAGSAYLFDTATGTELYKLTEASYAQSTNNFGIAVGIDGTTAIVGAGGHSHSISSLMGRKPPYSKAGMALPTFMTRVQGSKPQS